MAQSSSMLEAGTSGSHLTLLRVFQGTQGFIHRGPGGPYIELKPLKVSVED